MFALKVRHTLERSPIMTIALIMSICLSIVLGITTMISQKNLKSEKAEKATMAEAVKEAKRELEDTKAIGDKLNKELEKAYKDCAELRKAAEDAASRYQEATAEIRDIKTAGQTAEKMAEKAAKAEEEATAAKQRAEAAAKELMETNKEGDLAKDKLRATQGEIREAEEKLYSLSELYRAITDKAEDSKALEAKSAAIDTEIKSIADTIRREEWAEDYLLDSDNRSTIAILLAYDEHSNLLASAAVTLNSGANYSAVGFYRLWCEVENAAKQDQKDLQEKLAGSAKILCFAKSIHATTGEGKIIFPHFKGDVEIEIGGAKVTMLDPDPRKIQGFIGHEARKKQEAQIEALRKKQQGIQQQIFTIAQSELVNPIADALLTDK